MSARPTLAKQLYDRVRAADPVTRRFVLDDIAAQWGRNFADLIAARVKAEEEAERAEKRRWR